MSSKKANPAELAIINMTRAEKRLSVLSIMFEEENFGDIVEECVHIVESAIASLVCSAGILPDPDLDLIEQFEGAADELDPIVSENIEKIVEIHEEVVDWYECDELPDCEETAELMDWVTRLTKLTQRVVKDLDE